MTTHTTWDGTPVSVYHTQTGPPNNRRGNSTREANVPRIFQPSDELHAAIFSPKTGTFRYEKAKNMTLYERTTWNHLWDAVCCKTISPMEAWACIESGFVLENLTVRASNYMHLLN